MRQAVLTYNCGPFEKRSRPVAIAYVQEFTIKDGDTSTTGYDAVSSALNLQDTPDGLLIHTAGFDHDAGVFRIFDVWETREHGEKFLKERLNPIIEPMAAAAMQPQQLERGIHAVCVGRQGRREPYHGSRERVRSAQAPGAMGRIGAGRESWRLQVVT